MQSAELLMAGAKEPQRAALRIAFVGKQNKQGDDPHGPLP